jgi:hypothetical protein
MDTLFIKMRTTIFPTHQDTCLPKKMVWGVCLIVKNGLAFSISKIHDLTLGARLVHGTLTIPTKGHGQPMKVDIFGIYGPATKDFAVNLPY